LVAEIGRAAAASQQPAAMDATELALTTASDYLRTRTGDKVRKWVKISTLVLCGSLLPLDWWSNSGRVMTSACPVPAAIFRGGRFHN
jgi:hypothetical protein